MNQRQLSQPTTIKSQLYTPNPHWIHHPNPLFQKFKQKILSAEKSKNYSHQYSTQRNHVSSTAEKSRQLEKSQNIMIQGQFNLSYQQKIQQSSSLPKLNYLNLLGVKSHPSSTRRKRKMISIHPKTSLKASKESNSDLNQIQNRIKCLSLTKYNPSFISWKYKSYFDNSKTTHQKQQYNSDIKQKSKISQNIDIPQHQVQENSKEGSSPNITLLDFIRKEQTVKGSLQLVTHRRLKYNDGKVRRKNK